MICCRALRGGRLAWVSYFPRTLTLLLFWTFKLVNSEHERPLWAARPSDYSKLLHEYSIAAKLRLTFRDRNKPNNLPTALRTSRGYAYTSVQLSSKLHPVQVIKVGTSSLVRPEHNTLNLSNLARLCEVVRELKAQQHRCCCLGCFCTLKAASVVQDVPSAFRISFKKG
jgi:hypothetical protein